MKPYNEGEMEGRRGRSNANRFNAGSRSSIGTTRMGTPRNDDIDIDRYPSWRQHQQTQVTAQQRNVSNSVTSMQATAPDTNASSSAVGGTNQRVVVPAPATAGNNNFIQDDDTYASLTSSQDQARWNDMVLPDSSSPAGATPNSHLGYDDDYYYSKKKDDKIEEAKAEEQAVWDGMLVDPDTAVSSTTVTGTNSGNTNSNSKKKEANGQNQGGEQAVETQQNDSRSDNAMAAGAATTASPSPATPTAGAFAVSADETVQRGGEADTFTQVSEAETNLQHDEENTVSAPNQNDEDGSPVVVQAHLVAHDDSQYVERIQQLEAMVQQQQQQLQQPMAPLVHAEIASAAPEVMQDNNDDEMPPPSPSVSEQEQQSARSNKGAMRSWIMKNRRNRCIALGLAAVVVVAVVVAIVIPLSNSSSGSSSSSNKGVASNNNSSSTGPPSRTSTPLSEEPSVAPTTDTGSPVATSQPTVAPTETTSPPPTVAVTTQNPTRLPTRRPTSPPTTALPTTGSPSPPPPPPTPVALLPDGSWQPLGQELGGKAEEDRFGSSVSLSRDARVLAVGADQNYHTDRPGYVSVFESDDSTGSWVAKGQELVGEANGDWFGNSVALNGDGTILAVGAYWNDGGGDHAGHVRVFEHDTRTNQWVQLGSDIDGEAEYDWFGYSLSLSKAGDILAVGAIHGSDNSGGSVRTFQHNRENNSWEPLGQTLVGQAVNDEFGVSVSLSSSGAVLATGAIDNDSGGRDAGQVSMYQYNSASSEWGPMGSPINGLVRNGFFGSSVSLDDSGMVVAVGAPGTIDDERVLVYAYDGATSEWIQRGQTLESQETGNNDFGESVSLSGDGNVLAVGSRWHDVNGLEDSGQVTIFQYNANTMGWDTVGEPLNGIAADDYFGGSVSLSEDGTVVAVGAYYRDFNGNTDAGSASVYTLN